MDLKKYSSRWVEAGAENTQWGGGKVAVVRWQQWWLTVWVALDSCVADKNWEGHLGSESSQPQARP